MRDLKTIHYRGGIVKFSIPSNWIEEYGPESGGAFYEDTPGSGTLRLNVVTAKSPDPISTDTAHSLLAGLGANRTVKQLPNGNAISYRIEQTSENRTAIEIHYWEIASPVHPDHIRIATFSFTILASQREDTGMRDDIDLLAGIIPNAEFSTTLGISGNISPKPWWKCW